MVRIVAAVLIAALAGSSSIAQQPSNAQTPIAPQTTAPDPVGAAAIQSGEITNSTMQHDPQRAHSAPVSRPRSRTRTPNGNAPIVPSTPR